MNSSAPSKQPRTPAFSPDAVDVSRKLCVIIDEHSARSALAYSAFTKMSVLWTLGLNPSNRIVMVNSLIDALTKLDVGDDDAHFFDGSDLERC